MVFHLVPEIKAASVFYPYIACKWLTLLPAFVYAILKILNGYVLDLFLSPWTLLVKAVGLALAVASGLSLGKEVRACYRLF